MLYLSIALFCQHLRGVICIFSTLPTSPIAVASVQPHTCVCNIHSPVQCPGPMRCYVFPGSTSPARKKTMILSCPSNSGRQNYIKFHGTDIHKTAQTWGEFRKKWKNLKHKMQKKNKQIPGGLNRVEQNGENQKSQKNPGQCWVDPTRTEQCVYVGRWEKLRRTGKSGEHLRQRAQSWQESNTSVSFSQFHATVFAWKFARKYRFTRQTRPFWRRSRENRVFTIQPYILQ